MGYLGDTGRSTKASADGIAGLVAVVDGQPQFIASDEVGRLWNRLFVNGAAVSTANPLPVLAAAGGASQLVAPIFWSTDDGVLTPELDWYDSAALESLKAATAVKATPGRVYEFTGFNDSASTVYFFLINTAVVAANGDAGLVVIRVPAGGSFSYTPPGGKFFSTGIAWAASSSSAVVALPVACARVNVGFK